MRHTAKIDPAPSDAMDNDVMNEMENFEATGIFEHKPDPDYLADSDALDDEFLEGYEHVEAEDVFDDELSFVLGED